MARKSLTPISASKVTGLATPSADTDAANKKYVDDNSGGGGGMTVSTTPPSSPSSGDEWLNSNTGEELVWYHDGTTGQWLLKEGVSGGGGTNPSCIPVSALLEGTLSIVSNELHLVDGVISYSEGYDSTGALNSIEELTDADIIPTGDWNAQSLEPNGANNDSTTDAVPTMTSNTAPSGVASASTTLSGYDPYQAYADNGDVPYGWLPGDYVITGWLQYQFPTAKIINKYTIQAEGAHLTRSPKDWTIEASNTGAFAGEEVTLHTATGEIGWTDEEVRVFTFSNSTAYLYYRIDVTGSGTDTRYMNISEMQYIEATMSTSNNYLKKIKGGAYQTTLIRPVFNETSAVADYYLGGKWYNSSGTEYTTPITYFPVIIQTDASKNVTAIVKFNIPNMVTESLAVATLIASDLPTTDPLMNGVIWSNSGVLTLSAGSN